MSPVNGSNPSDYTSSLKSSGITSTGDVQQPSKLMIVEFDSCKEKQVGIFDPSFVNPFKHDKQKQQSGNTPEARAKAKITAKETFKKIQHQQGEKNSQYGTCWITKEGINKKIKKDDIDFWLEEGWSKGRTK